MATAFSKLSLLFAHQASDFHVHVDVSNVRSSPKVCTSFRRPLSLMAADCHTRFCYDAAMRGLGSIDSLSSILEGLARRLGTRIQVARKPLAPGLGLHRRRAHRVEYLARPDSLQETLSPGPQQCLAAPTHVPQTDTASETQQSSRRGTRYRDCVARRRDPLTDSCFCRRHLPSTATVTVSEVALAEVSLPMSQRYKILISVCCLHR